MVDKPSVRTNYSSATRLRRDSACGPYERESLEYSHGPLGHAQFVGGAPALRGAAAHAHRLAGQEWEDRVREC